MMRVPLYVVVAVLLAEVTAEAALVFDFDSGLGPNFSVWNDGGLWTVDTTGTNLRISKPADDGTFRPTGFVAGGVSSNFILAGDFTVTVDFTLHDFPSAGIATGLNESLLIARSSSDSFFEVFRYRSELGDNIAVFAAPPGAGLGLTHSTITSGRYRIQRTGSTLTGSFADAGSSSFTSLASVDGFTDPMQVELVGVQGRSVVDGSRSTTAMDISYDNLVVEADNITGVVPEPASFTVWSLIVLIFAGAGWHRGRNR